MKKRLFEFSTDSLGVSYVECKNCDWKVIGRGHPQKIYDKSNKHECKGVMSYKEMIEK